MCVWVGVSESGCGCGEEKEEEEGGGGKWESPPVGPTLTQRPGDVCALDVRVVGDLGAPVASIPLS